MATVRFRLLLVTCLLALCASVRSVSAEEESWRKPFPSHRVIGNVYYVGTSELACFLITTPAGHMLINTGLVDSVPLIRAGIQKLGFRIEDVKLLLTMQAHFDHVAGMAEIKRLTGARMLATEQDAPLLEDGGKSDFFLGKKYWFTPVKVDELIKDGQKIQLGGVEVTAHLTPGHTKGSVTYTLQVVEGGRKYNVVIANMASIVVEKLLGNPKYPNMAADFAKTFEVQKSLPCDVFLSAHASQYGMHGKYKPDAAYNPSTFVDPEGYRAAVAGYEKAYTEQLARERSAR
jgi:metallo-beta-lactamase class B